MDGRECLHGQVGEKSLALEFADEVREFVVTAVDLVSADETPFADVNPLVRLVHTLVGEGVTVNDVLGEDVAYGFDAAIFTLGLEQGLILFGKIIQEAFPASGGIVGQQFNAIDPGDGPDGIVLILELGVLFGFDAGLADGEFSSEDFDEEVAVTASRFQETRIDAFRLRFHKVEHGVHFAGIGKHLAVSRHPFLGLDLGVHSALSFSECDLSGAPEMETAKYKKRGRNLSTFLVPGRKPFLRTSHVHAKAQTFTDLSGVGNLKTARF